MKILTAIASIIWIGFFIGILSGYDPSRFVIGISFLITSTYFMEHLTEGE